jgi:hypothetical protein
MSHIILAYPLPWAKTRQSRVRYYNQGPEKSCIFPRATQWVEEPRPPESPVMLGILETAE